MDELPAAEHQAEVRRVKQPDGEMGWEWCGSADGIVCLSPGLEAGGWLAGAPWPMRKVGEVYEPNGADADTGAERFRYTGLFQREN